MWRGGSPSAADRLAGALSQGQPATLSHSIFKGPHRTAAVRPVYALPCICVYI